MGDFYGTHPGDYAQAIDALKLGPTMRNTRYPGSDGDPYANPRSDAEHKCVVPLDNQMFSWSRSGPKYRVKADDIDINLVHPGDAAAYFAFLKQKEHPVKMYKNSWEPADEYTGELFHQYDFSTEKVSDKKPFCDLGVQLQPWSAATGFTQSGPGTASRFAYDGHCGC